MGGNKIETSMILKCEGVARCVSLSCSPSEVHHGLCDRAAVGLDDGKGWNLFDCSLSSMTSSKIIGGWKSDKQKAEGEGNAIDQISLSPDGRICVCASGAALEIFACGLLPHELKWR